MRKGDIETGDKRLIAEMLASKNGWVCAYCGINLIPFDDEYKYCTLVNGKWIIQDGYAFAELDHRNPVSKGGSNNIRNLALSCQKCNRQKGNKTEVEYMAWRKRT